MKKRLLFSLFLLIGATLMSCGSNEEGKFVSNDIDFYRTKDTPDRKVNLRFYENAPNVPYVGVKQFYKEFYNTEYTMSQKGDTYQFNKNDKAFIAFDPNNEIMSILNIAEISKHPDFSASNSTIFLKEEKKLKTTPQVKTVDLKNYKINTYKGNNDVYVPLQLISNLTANTHLFCITYNGKNLYEIDYKGQLSNYTSRMESFYGDKYLEPILVDEERKEDVIDFTYNLLCLEIDNFRGYTSQMVFIDNNILSNGLNGTLEAKYPKLKKLLLSKNKEEYCAGIVSVFGGLFDGGHTGFLSNFAQHYPNIKDVLANEHEISLLSAKSTLSQLAKTYKKSQIVVEKKETFGIDDTKYYYHLDEANHLAFIGFDSFEVNYKGWDEYYARLATGEEATPPAEGDSYAFIRKALFKALEDGATNVVLDIASNGGGDSSALLGIYGLLNNAEACFSTNDIVAKSRTDEYYLVDINLDGKYDELDKQECARLEGLNIVVLTSSVSFSCGNLLPSLLKEAGYRTIGENTSGGSCAIHIETTGDGLLYVRSSCECLSDISGNNIDSGVAVDYSLARQEDNPSIISQHSDIPEEFKNLILVTYDDFYNSSKVLEAINAIKGDKK